MSLLDELAVENEIQSPKCKVCQWLERVDPEDLAAFQAHVAANGDKSKLFRACGRIDPPIGVAYSTLSRHVRECL